MVFLLSPPPLFGFALIRVGDGKLGGFQSSTHTWARQCSTVRKRGLRLTDSLQPCGRDGCGGVVRPSEHAERRRGQGSPVNLLRKEQSSSCGACGSCGRGRGERGAELDWSPDHGALRSDQRVRPSQARGGLSGGLWDNFGLMDLDSN